MAAQATCVAVHTALPHKVKKRCNYNWQNRPPVLNHSGDQVLQLPPEKEKQNIRFGPPVRIVCFSFVVPIMYVTYMSWISSHLAQHQMTFSGHIKMIFAHHQLYSPGLDSWSFCVCFFYYLCWWTVAPATVGNCNGSPAGHVRDLIPCYIFSVKCCWSMGHNCRPNSVIVSMND